MEPGGAVEGPDGDLPVFARSAVKPLQALGSVRAGVVSSGESTTLTPSPDRHANSCAVVSTAASGRNEVTSTPTVGMSHSKTMSRTMIRTDQPPRRTSAASPLGGGASSTSVGSGAVSVIALPPPHGTAAR